MCCVAEAPVSFTVPLKDTTVPEEESVTLECELSKPDQKVKWLKDGKEIKPDKKRGIEIKVDGKKHILTIPKSLVDDTGDYTVKCGDVESKAKLTVEGKNGVNTRNMKLLLRFVFSLSVVSPFPLSIPAIMYLK